MNFPQPFGEKGASASDLHRRAEAWKQLAANGAVTLEPVKPVHAHDRCPALSSDSRLRCALHTGHDPADLHIWTLLTDNELVEMAKLNIEAGTVVVVHSNGNGHHH